MADLNGYCLLCNATYFLDHAGNKCEKVDVINEVEGCSFYTDTQICKSCS